VVVVVIVAVVGCVVGVCDCGWCHCRFGFVWVTRPVT
jgi:hypothetical protein